MAEQKTINHLGRDMWFTSLISLLAGVVTSLLLGLLAFLLMSPVEAAESIAPRTPQQLHRTGSSLVRYSGVHCC